MTTEWWMLNSLATSHVVVRGSALVITLSWSLSTSDGWATVFLIFKAPISFAKCLEPPLHCMLNSSSWAKCIVDVAKMSPLLYDSF